ncbi:MAG: MerR family transcriptional regulator [Anaerolineales bacterium]|nr:MerR family transcriptional regulator [Anaerolineales bacterium]
MYTIKELANLAGVTTRTLRYYDQMGILTPAELGSNNYRYYDHDNLLRLQQILFYRELDVPLKEIQFILSRPVFQLLPALKNHQEALQKKVERYQALLGTTQKTISSLNRGKSMAENEYFEGFDETQYEEETRDRWSHTSQYKESQRKWSSYSKDQKEEIKKEGSRITLRMVTENPEVRPDDPDVQEAVEDYYVYLNQYFYICEVEFLRTLADMWVQDPRFAVNYERIREGGAAFVREAVHIYCDTYEPEGKNTHY